MPSRRAPSPQIHTPATTTTTVLAKAIHAPHCAARIAAASPSSEPAVPGARGTRPDPKPRASSCTGSRSAWLDGRGVRPSAEVVISGDTWLHRLAGALTSHAVTGDDLTDTRDPANGAERSLRIRRRCLRNREYELVIVAAAECEPLRLRGVKTREQRRRQRQLLELQNRADPAGVAQLAEVAKQPVRNVNRCARNTAQRNAERKPGLGEPVAPYQRRIVIRSPAVAQQ